MVEYARLVEGKVIPCSMEEADWDSPSKVVKRTEVKEWSISTVFLPINHSFVPGERLHFETLIFPEDLKPYGGIMERYSTYDAAVSGHDMLVNEIACYRNEDA